MLRFFDSGFCNYEYHCISNLKNPQVSEHTHEIKHQSCFLLHLLHLPLLSSASYPPTNPGKKSINPSVARQAIIIFLQLFFLLQIATILPVYFIFPPGAHKNESHVEFVVIIGLCRENTSRQKVLFHIFFVGYISIDVNKANL